MSAPPELLTCMGCGKTYAAEELHTCAATATPPAAAAPPPFAASPPPNAPSAAQTAAPAPEVEAAPDSNDPLVGTILADRYQILKRVGEGGMGAVYKARHVVLNNIVAVKVMLQTPNGEAQQRFLREAQLASKINHPNTVYITDFGALPNGMSFLVMEFVEGKTLTKAIGRKPVDPLRGCQIALQIARGMQVIHDRGIIHRDLKPDNIFVVQDGDQDFVKIVDFGIAKEATVRNPEPASGTPANRSQLTRMGAVVGTPDYMAPEQINGIQVDARTDQYAFGCILYQILSGDVPLKGETSMLTLVMHMSEPPPPLRQRYPHLAVSDSLEALVMRMLSKSPDQRFGSMREVAEILEREIDLLLVQRGEKVNVNKATLALLLPKSLGTQVFIRGRSVPLWGIAALAGVLLLTSGFLVYRQFIADRLAASAMLQPGELEALRKRALDVLKEYLQAPDPEQRLTAVSALGQTRDGELHELAERLLSDSSSKVAAQAAAALGQLGARQATAALMPRLEPSVALNVRLAAAAALDQLGEPRGRAVLQEALKDSTEEVRLRAAFLLCNSGSAEAKEILKELLRRNAVADNAAIDLLGCLASSGDDAAQKLLIERLGSAKPEELRLAAAAKLAQLGEAEGQKLLRSLAAKPGPMQLLAARLLAGPEEPAALAVLRNVVKSTHGAAAARVLAAEGLGAGEQVIDARLLGKLLQAVKEPALRQALASAIVQLAASDPATASSQSLGWARSALGDKNWAIREAAVAVLGDGRADTAVPLLKDMLNDEDARIRRSAARSLGRQVSSSALLALLRSLDDRDASVRLETLRAISRVGQALGQQALGEAEKKEVLARLNRVVSSGSASEQILARSALLRIGDASQVAHFGAFKNDPDAAVRQLVAEQSPNDADLLSLLKDPVFEVRFAAARSLAEKGNRAALPVLKEGLAHGGPVAIAAYGLLAKLGEKGQPPEDLNEILSSGSTDQRLAAVEALQRLPAALAVPLLLKAARDPEALVRRLVAEVAADLPAGSEQPPGIPVLRILVNDRDPSVRARAAMLLARLALPAVPAKAQSAAAQNAEDAKAKGAPTHGGDAAASEPVDAGAQAEPPPDGGTQASQPTGRGKLIVESAGGIAQFQIEHRPWQSAAGQTISLPAGTYHVTYLNGEQDVVITDKQTVRLRIPESQVEQLARTGVESYQRKDFRTARKLFEKANSLCTRIRRHGPACTNLSNEMSFRLAQIYESEQRWADAMSEYQKLVGGMVKLKQDQKVLVQESILRLAPRVGEVVISKLVKGKCQTLHVWLPPGTHILDVGSRSETVKVRANQSLSVGSCEER